MNVSIAVAYGVETGTIQRPESINYDENGDIESWVGSPKPTAEVLAAAWEAFGGENGLSDRIAKQKRKEAFAGEADPLFFQVQRGEVEQSVYDAKVAEIRTRFPLSTD